MEVKKHIFITGTSNISWKDAINNAILETSKTIDFIESITVLEQKASISGNKISTYFVELDLCFTIDKERK